MASIRKVNLDSTSYEDINFELMPGSSNEGSEEGLDENMIEGMFVLS